MIITEATLI